MKVLKRLVLAFVAVMGVAALLLMASFMQRERDLAARTPPTIAEMLQLVEHSTALPSDVFAPFDGEEAAVEACDHAAAGLPVRLEGLPSQAVLEARFKIDGNWYHRSRAKLTPMLKVAESAMRALGADFAADSQAWQIGHELMTQGDWAGARRYYYELLDAPHFSGIHYLVWVESDPERAARLLEMSCTRKNNAFLLTNAVDLARATHSEVLAEHYLEQLRLQHPEYAQRYEDKHRKGVKKH